jgi:hypothetical protein
LAAAGVALDIDWPDDYAAFMHSTDGGEGWVGENYIAFWSATELVEYNRDNQVHEYAPNLVIFGSDGGGEAFAFDRSKQPPAIVMVPFIGLDAPVPQGATFTDFLARLLAGGPFD